MPISDRWTCEEDIKSHRRRGADTMQAGNAGCLWQQALLHAPTNIHHASMSRPIPQGYYLHTYWKRPVSSYPGHVNCSVAQGYYKTTGSRYRSAAVFCDRYKLRDQTELNSVLFQTTKISQSPHVDHWIISPACHFTARQNISERSFCLLPENVGCFSRHSVYL